MSTWINDQKLLALAAEPPRRGALYKGNVARIRVSAHGRGVSPFYARVGQEIRDMIANHNEQAIDLSWHTVLGHITEWLKEQDQKWQDEHRAEIDEFNYNRLHAWAFRQKPQLKIKTVLTEVLHITEEETRLVEKMVQEHIRHNIDGVLSGQFELKDLLCVDEMAFQYDESLGFTVVEKDTTNLRKNKISNAKGTLQSTCQVLLAFKSRNSMTFVCDAFTRSTRQLVYFLSCRSAFALKGTCTHVVWCSFNVL